MKAKKHKAGRKTTHAKTHRTKSQNPTQIAREKWRLAVQRCKEINRQWKNKLAEKTTEFKKKLEEIANSSYAKAVETVASDTRRRFEARAKAIAAAEAKFEKKFEKVLAKRNKRRGKTKNVSRKHETHPTTTHGTSTTRKLTGKRRGSKSTVATHAHTNHQTTTTPPQGSKRHGRKAGRKSTSHTLGHRTTTHATQRGRSAKRRVAVR